LVRELLDSGVPEECLGKIALYADERVQISRDDLVRALDQEFSVPRPTISVVTTPAIGNGARLLLDVIAVPNRRRSLPMTRRRRGTEPAAHAIRMGHWVFTDSVCAISFGGDLLAQTHAVMKYLYKMLEELGLTFSDVVKTNTFYVGGASARELHDNMRIRSSYYRRPGPVSTGIPVLGLGQPGAVIGVDLCLVVPAGSDQASDC
jgi:enamine deaminase RidA (YjgF/YER057c/UK114 family)